MKKLCTRSDFIAKYQCKTNGSERTQKTSVKNWKFRIGVRVVIIYSFRGRSVPVMWRNIVFITFSKSLKVPVLWSLKLLYLSQNLKIVQKMFQFVSKICLLALVVPTQTTEHQ